MTARLPATGRDDGEMPARVMATAAGSLLLAAACGGGGGGSSAATPAAPSIQNGSVDVGGVTRTYRVFVPPTLDRSRPAPLVVVLHGGGNSIEDTVKTTNFDKEASTWGFIAAYPEGTGQAWNAGFCCGSAPSRHVDDVGFLARFLDQVEADHNVDRTRVFLAGVSNGAMMAYRFACEHADQVTAVGSVAGSMRPGECHPSRPVSIIELHGTADTLVPYAGGVPDAPEAFGAASYDSSAAVAGRWAEADGCPSPATDTVSGPVSTTTWTGCRNGASVSLVTVEGGGHTWFGPGLGPANGALDATDVIWRFFDGLRPSR